MRKIRALVRTWLLLDFFGDARRTGGATSSLTTTIFTQSFLALVFAALLYPETPPVPFAAANLSLSSLLVAIGVLGNEDRQDRRRADQVLLGSAPLGRVTVALARSGHAAFHVCLVTIGMALPPALLLAMLRHQWLAAPAYVLLACACSGLAGGALGLTLQALHRLVGPARAALIAGTGKAVLLGGGFVLFALGMQHLQQTAGELPIGRFGAELLPPYHAARLLAAPIAEAWRLLPLLAGAALLLILAAIVGEAESPRRVRAGGQGPLRRLLRMLAGRGPRLGVAEFVALSMWRSAAFRARVLPLLGLPAGMAFLSLAGESPTRGFMFTCLLLQIPTIYLPFLIAFLPRADQPGTAWVFAQAPPLPVQVVRDATWRALISHVLVPVHALALALLWCFHPTRLDATAAALFSLGVGVVASRMMLRSLASVPFTEDGDADASTDLGHLFAAAMLLGALGVGFGGMLPTPARWPLAALACGLAASLLRRAPPAEGHLLAPARVRAADPSPEAPATTKDPSPRPATAASLTRELRAILVLYAAVCVLPLAIGTMFAA
ncbi:MAG TPA: hypothetical protein VFZ65_06880 [Planctomycetota bacterium]|nr:hypothetical protein [Planctomycetota bacterium]